MILLSMDGPESHINSANRSLGAQLLNQKLMRKVPLVQNDKMSKREKSRRYKDINKEDIYIYMIKKSFGASTNKFSQLFSQLSNIIIL